LGELYFTADNPCLRAFHKVGVHSQAQLVARLLADSPRPS
jgi:DNA-binding CsgD family transcriptional regulator